MYTDNYYTSPALYADMTHLGFGGCGTVRCNRRGLPPEMKAKLRKGEMVASTAEEGMMALKWMDKRPVHMLSTIHDDSVVTKQRRTRLAPDGREEIRKPHAVEGYNRHMGGVDKSDQLLSYYGFGHRTVKWWRRAWFHLIDMAVVNSYILYKESSQSARKLTHEKYRILLASELLVEAGEAPHVHPGGRASHPLPSSSRLTERHFPGKTAAGVGGKPSQLDCVVCSHKKGRGRRTTTFTCKDCNLPMCIVPCFELYHTKVDPVRYL